MLSLSVSVVFEHTLNINIKSLHCIQALLKYNKLQPIRMGKKAEGHLDDTIAET